MPSTGQYGGVFTSCCLYTRTFIPELSPPGDLLSSWKIKKGGNLCFGS